MRKQFGSRRRAIGAALAVACAGTAGIAAASTGAPVYYVSPTGNDSADGLTPATAWATLDKVNATTYAPGTQVLLERGGEWRGQLVASSSGAAGEPIVYGAYGTGAKPKIWGSDVVDNGAFSPVAGTTSVYAAPVSTTVNSLLINHAFTHSSTLVLGQSDPTANLNYVSSTPNTWYYDGTQVYVNTGGSDPRTDARTYTAAVRDDVVLAQGKSNLVFQNLAVDESAKYNAGYAFRVQDSTNVTIENSDAYRAGKHDFGVISSTGFVGDNLYATDSMPDQGFGGATAFVSFSDSTDPGGTSVWSNDRVENLGAGVGAFYTHGAGLASVTVRNISADGAGVSFGNEGSTVIRMEGGTITNEGVSIFGPNVVVEGVRIVGPAGRIDVRGSNDTVMNSVMVGTLPVTSYPGAILDFGQGTRLLFNTVLMDPSNPNLSDLVRVNPDTGLQLVGNILQGGGLHDWFTGSASLTAEGNLYSPDAVFTVNGTSMTLAQWQAMGYDLTSLAGVPMFVDPAGGNYALVSTSPGFDAAGVDPATYQVLTDILGNPRVSGSGADIGAFEAVVSEPSTVAAMAVAAGATVCRRRRRRC